MREIFTITSERDGPVCTCIARAFLSRGYTLSRGKDSHESGPFRPRSPWNPRTPSLQRKREAGFSPSSPDLFRRFYRPSSIVLPFPFFLSSPARSRDRATTGSPSGVPSCFPRGSNNKLIAEDNGSEWTLMDFPPPLTHVNDRAIARTRDPRANDVCRRALLNCAGTRDRVRSAVATTRRLRERCRKRRLYLV